MGVSIEHILETHNHADHVSGHGRLAAATGATIHVHRARASPTTTHEPFDDGWELELGARARARAAHARPPARAHRVRARSTPRAAPEPWAVLTGDTLFVGDIARPDLAVDKEEGARGIFRSLHEQLLDAARDDVEVWPGHLGGSLCGGPGDGPEGLLDDRLRAPPQRAAARSTTRTRSSTRATADARPAAAELPGDRRASTAARCVTDGGRGAAAHAAPGRAAARRRAGRRRPHRRCSSTRRTSRARSATPIAAAPASARGSPGSPSRDQEVVLVGRDDDDALHAAELAAAVGVARDRAATWPAA